MYSISDWNYDETIRKVHEKGVTFNVSSVKSKIATFVGMILAMVTISVGQGFNVEWELDNLGIVPQLPSYISLTTTSNTTNTGNEFDLDNSGVPEITVYETVNSNSNNLKDIKIYDGATHILKYTVNCLNFTTLIHQNTTNLISNPCYFFDVDNDGTKEMLIKPDANSSNSSTVLFINVQTSIIKYEMDSLVSWGVYDLNHDSHPKFWCVKANYSTDSTGYRKPLYKLQIWGSGLVKSNSSSLMKQNLARLIGNSPNPFVTSTKIEYYVPQKQNVQLQIFSSDGKLLRSLVDGPQKMGEYSAVWDAKTDNGQLMAIGSYYYRLKIGDFVSSKKMVGLR